MTTSQILRKCLFPAAGYGTRFLPATKAMPKEMMPIVNKPLIQYGVEEALEAGMTDMAIVTGRGKRALEDHFDVNFELEAQIQGTEKETYLDGIRAIMQEASFTYTRQKSMRGLGDAILTAENMIGDEAFAVVLADDLCVHQGPGVLAQMLELYRQFRCSIVAIMEVPEGETHKYGVIAGEPLKDDLFRIERMVEKPAPGQEPSRLAIIGRYVLTPDIFDILRTTPVGKNGELQITDALAEQARRGCVLAYRFKGQRFDCGSIDGYVEATNYCYRKTQQSC